METDPQEIIARSRENKATLRARYVAHAALFGARARGSNIAIMIEIDPAARVGVWEYVGPKEFIARSFERPVDVVNRDRLKLSAIISCFV